MIILFQVSIGNQTFEIKGDHKLVASIGDTVIVAGYADRVVDRIVNYQKDFAIVKLRGELMGDTSALSTFTALGWKEVKS